MATRTTRKERALATRRRMLEAAYRLFCAHGYLPTTMDAIAREAEVAVQTLYFTFGTKGSILGETLGAAVLGFEAWGGVPERFDAVERLQSDFRWYPEFAAEPEARGALAVFVEGGVPVLRRVAPLMAALHAAAHDEDAAAVVRLAEERRHASFREVVRQLARKQGGLRPGLAPARATDILLVLFSGETYQALATGRQWSAIACKRWFVDVLSQQLLAGP